MMGRGPNHMTLHLKTNDLDVETREDMCDELKKKDFFCARNLKKSHFAFISLFVIN